MLWGIFNKINWTGWAFVAFLAMLVNWLLDPVAVATLIMDATAAFLAFVASFLPEAVDTAITAFATNLTSGPFHYIIRIAIYLLGIVIDPTVLALILGAYFIIIPSALTIRLGFWLYGKIPVFGKGAS